MLAVPPLVLAVGVKVAVRVRPLPEIAPSVPPVTTTSPLVPFQVKVAPGSSLKVKVTVAVSPILSALTLLVMARVGASVSPVMATLVVLARLLWLLALVNRPAATEMAAERLCAAFGVKVAV